MRKFLTFAVVAAVWGCTDFTEELNPYEPQKLSSREKLASKHCSSENDGEIVIMKGNDRISTIYTCTDGVWIGDHKDTVEYGQKFSSSSLAEKLSSSSKKSSSSSGKEPVVIKPESSSSGKGDKADDGEAAPKSSSSVAVEPSSSAGAAVIPTPGSSGNPVIIKPASSSDAGSGDVPGSSASTSIVPPPSGTAGELGSCAPDKAVINKGESVVYKFTPNTSSGYTAMDFVKTNYEWNYGTGVGDGSGSMTNSDKVTYAASGSASASVTVTMADGKTETVACAPLQVNGDPITGCECKAAAATADVAADGVASWTVSGCTSASEIIGYTWDGATGDGANATYTFTEKGQTRAPTVKVSNNDNIVETVTCEEVKSVDANSPDYIFELADNKLPEDMIDVANEGCMTIRGTWTNSFDLPKIQVLCDMKEPNDSTFTFKMTYGGSPVYTLETSDTWGFSNAGGEIGTLKDGENQFDNICVEFTGEDFVTCRLQL